MRHMCMCMHTTMHADMRLALARIKRFEASSGRAEANGWDTDPYPRGIDVCMDVCIDMRMDICMDMRAVQNIPLLRDFVNENVLDAALYMTPFYQRRHTCLCTCLCTHVYINIYAHVPTHFYIHMSTHMSIHISTHMSVSIFFTHVCTPA